MAKGKGEQTSKSVSTTASKGLQKPGSLSNKDVQRLAGSALTQAPNKKKR